MSKTTGRNSVLVLGNVLLKPKLGLNSIINYMIYLPIGNRLRQMKTKLDYLTSKKQLRSIILKKQRLLRPKKMFQSFRTETKGLPNLEINSMISNIWDQLQANCSGHMSKLMLVKFYLPWFIKIVSNQSICIISSRLYILQPS